MVPGNSAQNSRAYRAAQQRRVSKTLFATKRNGQSRAEQRRHRHAGIFREGVNAGLSLTRKGKVHRKMAPMAMRVTEMGEREGCPVIGQIEVASRRGDQITSPETELTSCWRSTRELLRNRCMKQSK